MTQSALSNEKTGFWAGGVNVIFELQPSRLSSDEVRWSTFDGRATHALPKRYDCALISGIVDNSLELVCCNARHDFCKSKSLEVDKVAQDLEVVEKSNEFVNISVNV